MKLIALKGRHDCGKSETIGIHLRDADRNTCRKKRTVEDKG